MREIKFRAWTPAEDDEPGYMISGDDLAFGEYLLPVTDLLSQEGIMQYTGLKDKNGKEIFELDYAEKDGCIYLVMWYKNKYILKDISNGDIIELDKNINVRSNYYENAEKFTGEYSKI